MSEQNVAAGNQPAPEGAASAKRPAPRGQLYLKVSEKGALSVYGLGRFPVTLYREQWERLLAAADMIRQFIAENDQGLKKKEKE